MEEIFTCRKCGECCRGYGGTVVTDADILNISEAIGTDRRRFVRRYCRMSGDKRVLAQREDGYCVFWDGLCTIHPVKPRMCRSWPFLGAVLVDVANWYAMADVCPGMRKDAPAALVRDRVRAALEKNPQWQSHFSGSTT